MPLSQQERTLSVSTPLGEDVLLIRRMTATERLSRLFEYQLELVSEDINIKHEDLLGQPVTVRLDLLDDGRRFFNGIVSRFSQVGFDGAFAVFQATLVPWTWFLTRTADCRIFQDKTVPDIIKEIFREHGFTDFEESLSGSFRQWVYCVQYRETDFNFVSRLMEQEGIYFYFKHEDGKHTLVLADSYSAHSPYPGYEEIPYYPPDETSLRERDHISDWSVLQAVQPGTFAHTDFDFTAPKKNLLEKRSNPKNHEQAEYEVYDYPGEYLENSNGENYARIRLEELHADYETIQGKGNARGLATGSLFTLTNYRREDQNREYLIVSANYQLQSDVFGSGGETPGAPVFQCSITATDAQTPYRPPRITPKPIVQGPQTAIVVGKAGEEIWTEKYGRVKVQFHWDRYGKSDENSSCWVRVSHPWAGKSWGAIAIPRIGQEVIVDFLEGDPDQPMITGRVYNADTMPPYGLPGGAVISGIKSNSTKGGGGYNEFVMDDTKGNEMVREHAQFNKDTTVENDQTLTVHNNRTSTIDVDDTESVGNNQTISIGVNQTLTVGANQTVTVGANRSVSVGSNKTETIGASKAETIAVAKALTIGGAYQVSVGAVMNETIGGAKAEEIGGAKIVGVGAVSSESVGASKSVNAGTNISESAGAKFSASSGSTMSLNAGGDLSAKSKAKVLIDAASEITLKCGGAQIVLKSGGDILIKGTNITLKASGKIGAKAGGPMTLKGSKIAEN
ncbi:MAG: type VI secretion system tip protein TssI/VgrG [Pseudomonadota bacterium]|nr:type VI secretion system tip protein TssI/VgrG [Pseudomonadota bacterium]